MWGLDKLGAFWGTFDTPDDGIWDGLSGNGTVFRGAVGCGAGGCGR